MFLPFKRPRGPTARSAKKKPESTTFFCVLLHPFCENQAFRQAADGFTWYKILVNKTFPPKKTPLGLPSPPGPPSPSGRANRRLCLHLLPSMDYEVSHIMQTLRPLVLFGFAASASAFAPALSTGLSSSKFLH